MPEAATRIYRFGPFVLDVGDRSLKKDALRKSVWPDVAVEEGNLRRAYSVCARSSKRRLALVVILTDAVGTLLAEAFAHAMNIREDQRLCTASGADDGVEDDGFKEGEAQRVSRESDAPLRMRRDQIGGRKAHLVCPHARRRRFSVTFCPLPAIVVVPQLHPRYV